MYPAFPNEQDIFIKFMTDDKNRLTYDELRMLFSMYYDGDRTTELIEHLRANFPEKYRELREKAGLPPQEGTRTRINECMSQRQQLRAMLESASVPYVERDPGNIGVTINDGKAVMFTWDDSGDLVDIFGCDWF